MRSWRLRRWTRLVALVLLVASARLPHLGQDDLACAGLLAGGSSENASSLVDASGVVPQSDHCAICHWTRLLRSPLTIVKVTVASAGPAILVSQRALPVHADPVAAHLHARAPPAILL